MVRIFMSKCQVMPNNSAAGSHLADDGRSIPSYPEKLAITLKCCNNNNNTLLPQSNQPVGMLSSWSLLRTTVILFTCA